MSDMNSLIDPTKFIEKLNGINNIDKIGSFKVNDKVVVGEMEYSTLDLKKGQYNAYQVDDNLLIIHESNIDEITREYLENITWKFSGNVVSVDGGRFGFYDSEIVTKINIRNYNLSNSIPDIDMKYINFKSQTGMIINTNMVEDQIPSDIKNIDFGVASSTVTGDGFYFCYIKEDQMALLVGGITADTK